MKKTKKVSKARLTPKPKKVVKRARKPSKKLSIFGFFPYFSLLVLIVVFFSSFYVLSNKIQTKHNYIEAPKISKINESVSTASAKLKDKTPLPSPTNMEYSSSGTPSAQPNYGYCLHVPVLVYHHIQPEADAKTLGQTSLTVDNGIFAQQMAYIASQGYTTLWAPDLINALRSHTGLPPKSILITMDDGYADNDTYALPVLRQYGLKANLMLASGLVGNPDMLSVSQVQDLKNSGLIYFTNHTWSHYAINHGVQSKIDYEIDTGASVIQQYTGQSTNIFTYPYGSFNNNAISTLQSKGYIGAFSTIPGQYQCDSFIMALHRTHIGNAPLSAYGI